MYAVFSGGTIAYLGDNRTDALETLESKEGATLSQVNTLASLSGAFDTYKETFTEEDEPEDESDDIDVFNFGRIFTEEESDPLQDASDAMERILQKLDEAGFNAENYEEQLGILKDKATNAVAEVKSLGIKSMAVVGKGFVAIGDLLTAMEKIEADEGDTEGESEDESSEPVID